MTCGFDVPCYIGQFLAGLWWLPWLLYGIVGVLILVALAKVKELGGWPAVFGVVSLGLYGLGYWRGRSGKSINPIEQLPEDHPDAQPSHPKPHGKYQGIPGFDPDTGTWNK
jgi:hypothetical protein